MRSSDSSSFRTPTKEQKPSSAVTPNAERLKKLLESTKTSTTPINDELLKKLDTVLDNHLPNNSEKIAELENLCGRLTVALETTLDNNSSKLDQARKDKQKAEEELETLLRSFSSRQSPSIPVPIAPKDTVNPLITRFNEKTLPMEEQEQIIATLKKDKAAFTLASYNNKDGVETWVWNDPDPAKKGKPEYDITYTRLPDGTLNISHGKLASAYLCFEPDKTSGRHGTIIDVEKDTMTIHSPNSDGKIIVPSPKEVLGKHTARLQNEAMHNKGAALLSQ